MSQYKNMSVNKPVSHVSFLFLTLYMLYLSQNAATVIISALTMEEPLTTLVQLHTTKSHLVNMVQSVKVGYVLFVFVFLQNERVDPGQPTPSPHVFIAA